MMETNDRIRVLFVDDEEGNLKAFKASFRREMDVFLAQSGKEALELLEREHVHVIISDQRMPVMTGSEFLAIARERYPGSMRMLLTGYSDMEAVVNAINNGGIYAYASKPWDENDLKLRIQQAYEIQKLRSDKESLLGRYSQVFEASGDPIVIVDHKGSVLQVNNACAKLLGTSRDLLENAHFTNYLENPAGLVRSLRDRRNGNAFVNVDLTLRTATGDLVDCLITATYLGTQNGKRDVFQAIIKDVTDRKQEEKRLQRINSDLDKRVAVRTSQLLEALEDLGSFSYSVAHDLRSPLKNMAALGEMLQAAIGTDPAHKDTLHLVDRMRKGTARMTQLVDDLLRFSQTNSRQLDLKECDLAEIITHIIEETAPADRRSQIEVNVSPGTGLSADASMLNVALHNILSNALKFSRTTSAPRISITHTSDGEHDHIQVTDNGVGFDQKHMEQAFGVFKRLHSAEQFEGTGVGLAIVQRVVTKHHGKVWAESEPGKGTTIHIQLPKEHRAKAPIPFAKVA